jgi:hypothetical protein
MWPSSLLHGSIVGGVIASVAVVVASLVAVAQFHY